jgi:two-component system sensor histidine kinase RegB
VIVDQAHLKRPEAGFWKIESDSDARFAGETARHLALRWVVRLRYGFIVGEVALIAALAFGLRIPMPEIVLVTVIAVQTLSNWMLSMRKERLGESAEHLVGAVFVLDTLCLTMILGLSGGPANPFSLLYLVQIAFSAIVLRRSWTWTLGLISTVSFGLLFWVSRDVPAFHEHSQAGEFSLHLFGMWLAFATAALLISFFVGKLSAESRKKERELLLMQRRLARNERLASLVTLSAGAAHEIATPLATIAVTAKEMEHEACVHIRNKRIEEDAQLIRSQVDRCRLILERMGAQGADPFGEAPKATGLRELLDKVKERFPAQQEQIQVLVDANSESCVIPIRAATEALAALVKNALDASSDGKPVVLQAVRPAAKHVRFVIRDEGVGMTPDVLERVAEPFFTTKGPGQGMGLGAFLAHLFAQTLGGQLSFESEVGRGCIAVLELPDMKHVAP